MRSLGIMVAGLLAMGLVAEGAVIMSLRREVKTLAKQVEDGRPEARNPDDGWRPPPRWAPPAGPAFAGTAVVTPGAAPAGRPVAAAPAAAPPGGEPPLPEALTSPEAREQLRQFVGSEISRLRDEERGQMGNRRDEAEQRARDRVSKELALSDDESRKVGEILGTMQQQRRDLMQSVRSGEKQWAEVGPEMAALRDKTQSGLRDVLGEDRSTKAQEILRQERGGGGGGPRGGGGPGGGPRGGPPGGGK